MIQYSECLIDTNHNVFYENAIESGGRIDEIKSSKVIDFKKYYSKILKRPEFDYDRMSEEIIILENQIY